VGFPMRALVKGVAQMYTYDLLKSPKEKNNKRKKRKKSLEEDKLKK
jgi:hypothetical protein